MLACAGKSLVGSAGWAWTQLAASKPAATAALRRLAMPRREGGESDAQTLREHVRVPFARPRRDF